LLLILALSWLLAPDCMARRCSRIAAGESVPSSAIDDVGLLNGKAELLFKI